MMFRLVRVAALAMRGLTSLFLGCALAGCAQHEGGPSAPYLPTPVQSEIDQGVAGLDNDARNVAWGPACGVASNSEAVTMQEKLRRRAYGKIPLLTRAQINARADASIARAGQPAGQDCMFTRQRWQMFRHEMSDAAPAGTSADLNIFLEASTNIGEAVACRVASREDGYRAMGGLAALYMRLGVGSLDSLIRQGAARIEAVGPVSSITCDVAAKFWPRYRRIASGQLPAPAARGGRPQPPAPADVGGPTKGPEPNRGLRELDGLEM